MTIRKNILTDLVHSLIETISLTKVYKPMQDFKPSKKAYKRDRLCKRFKSLKQRSNRRKASK